MTGNREQGIGYREKGGSAAWSAAILSLGFLSLFPIPYTLSPLHAYALSFDTLCVEKIDTHSAMVRWVTDGPSNGQVRYGLNTREASKMSLELMMDRDHRTFLHGLLEGEIYMYQVIARGEMEGEVRSAWKEFQTSGVPAPKIRSVEMAEVTKEGGRMIWRANIPVKGIFECGYDTSFAFRQAEDRFAPAHEVHIKRFSPRRQINYRILAEDARGLRAPLYEGSFMTAEHNIALRMPVRGTFTANAEPSAIKDTPPILARVTDGKLDYFEGMASSGDPARADQWVEVDIGKIERVDQVLTYWWQLAYPKKFTIKASLDGERWDTLGDTHDASAGVSMRSATGDPLWEHTADVGNRVYRYIRVEVPMGSPYHKRFSKYNFVQMFELKIYPPPPQGSR